jgi:hypothetical protein
MEAYSAGNYGALTMGAPIRPTCDNCYEYEEDCACEQFHGWTAEEIADRRMDFEKETDLDNS